MASEKTINFVLLKLGPFCDPEAAPSHPRELSLDTCPSLSLAAPFFLPPSFTKVARQATADAQRGLEHKEAAGASGGTMGDLWPVGVWIRMGCLEEGASELLDWHCW